MEGGALVLASGGVCVVGDTSRLKKDKLHRLQHCELQVGVITVPIIMTFSSFPQLWRDGR